MNTLTSGGGFKTRHLVRQLGILVLATSFALLFGCGGSYSVPVASSALKSTIAKSVEEGFNAKFSAGRMDGDSARSRDEETAFFDEFLQLWGQPVTDGIDYFEDQALTLPAGTERSTRTSVGEVFQSATTLNITAGKERGYQSQFQFTFNGTRFVYSLTGRTTSLGEFSQSGFYEAGAGEFQSQYTDSNGVNRTYQVVIRTDGTYQVNFNTGQNFQYVLNFAVDGSGSGQITGSNTLLPANIVWNSSGDGTITFQDASTLTFTNFNFEQF